MISSVNTNESEETYCFSNDFNFTLFSVHSLMQVKEGELELFVCCSIPKSFVDFESFHGVSIIRVSSICQQIMLNFGTNANVSCVTIEASNEMITTESIHSFKASNLLKVEALEEFTFVANGCIACVGVQQVHEECYFVTFFMAIELQHYQYSKEF